MNLRELRSLVPWLSPPALAYKGVKYVTEPLSGTLSQQHVHVHAHVVDALGGSTQSV